MHPLIGAILPVTGGAMMLGDGVTMEHPPLRPVCNFAHFGKFSELGHPDSEIRTTGLPEFER